MLKEKNSLDKPIKEFVEKEIQKTIKVEQFYQPMPESFRNPECENFMT